MASNFPLGINKVSWFWHKESIQLAALALISFLSFNKQPDDVWRHRWSEDRNTNDFKSSAVFTWCVKTVNVIKGVVVEVIILFPLLQQTTFLSLSLSPVLLQFWHLTTRCHWSSISRSPERRSISSSSASDERWQRWRRSWGWVRRRRCRGRGERYELGWEENKGGRKDEEMMTKEGDEEKRMGRKWGGRKGERGWSCSNVYFLSRRLMFSYRQNN